VISSSACRVPLALISFYFIFTQYATLVLYMLSLCVCVYHGKMADWIRMPFGMVSGVGREMGVLDGDGDRRREGAVWW